MHAPGMELLRVSLSGAAPRSRIENASVWEWTGSALDEGPDAADWFTRYLGKTCRLVRFDTGFFWLFLLSFLLELMDSCLWAWCFMSLHVMATMNSYI